MFAVNQKKQDLAINGKHVSITIHKPESVMHSLTVAVKELVIDLILWLSVNLFVFHMKNPALLITKVTAFYIFIKKKNSIKTYL